MYSLAREQPEDRLEIEGLYDLCFAPGRESLPSYRLREGVNPIPDLCLAARGEDGILAAAVRFWPVRVNDAHALLLGPIAVHPTCQGEGLGGMMIANCEGRARDLGWERMMLVGDEPYFGRFGFARLQGVDMPPPTNPDRILGLELIPGAWAGIGGAVTRCT